MSPGTAARGSISKELERARLRAHLARTLLRQSTSSKYEQSVILHCNILQRVQCVLYVAAFPCTRLVLPLVLAPTLARHTSRFSIKQCRPRSNIVVAASTAKWGRSGSSQRPRSEPTSSQEHAYVQQSSGDPQTPNLAANGCSKC